MFGIVVNSAFTTLSFLGGSPRGNLFLGGKLFSSKVHETSPVFVRNFILYGLTINWCVVFLCRLPTNVWLR